MRVISEYKKAEIVFARAMQWIALFPEGYTFDSLETMPGDKLTFTLYARNEQGEKINYCSDTITVSSWKT